MRLLIRSNAASLLRHWGTALAAVQFAGVNDWGKKVAVSFAASVALTVPRLMLDISKMLGDSDGK